MASRPQSPARPAIAIRTCVGCGARAVKSDLLRLVAVGDEIVADPPARMPGRGAYLHPSQECWERARRRRVIPRALRLPGPLRYDELVRHLQQASTGIRPPGEAAGRQD